MIAELLEQALKPVVRTGALTFRFADGGSFSLGDGSGGPCVVRFTDRWAPWAMLLDPDLANRRAFHRWAHGRGRGEHLRDPAHPAAAWLGGAALGPAALMLDRVRDGLRRALSRNERARSGRNVRHHYNLDDRLYALFLDPEWQYSCAYFQHPGQSLADAQLAKLRHIASKLVLRGGERVLDIGCGWGGMACHLAEGGAGQVLGVTLSEEQIRGARGRADARGLSDRTRFELRDYRDVEGVFDRIVSVGMFEHVGLAHYREFFEVCAARLAPDGVVLLHTIGVSDAPSLTNPWITKHVFPGGHLPSLSQVLPAIERAGLVVTDVEVLRLHYAETLRAWRNAFLARRDEAVALFDERFCRMWEYYLSMAETAFRCEGVVVFQVQLAHRVDAVPITRDYIVEREWRAP